MRCAFLLFLFCPDSTVVCPFGQPDHKVDLYSVISNQQLKQFYRCRN